ncbi:glycoside hydrolase family 5 protein [Sodiomyces alcalophilus JCM 7366]|uniref:glycoside hydrolase family 5 protein n=1 Tax=Sodiomyces alcalophilus JCM 7366 TaxID=591952 RepID=UPI0039B5AB8B
MKSQVGIAALLALAQSALAQVPEYGQCGGWEWIGPVTCTAGYYCQYWNPYYSQCIPGEPEPSPTSSSAPTSSAIPTSSSSSSSAPEPTTSPGACDGSFNFISAEDYVAGMNPAWNLGNTLDAIPYEGMWNNPPVEDHVFDYVVARGFKGVRIPVTWTNLHSSGSPDWTIDPTWLQRVADVIDMALARDLYVTVNVHHDSWEWADVTSPNANIAQIQERFRAIWEQVGEKFACASSRLSFESINEPPANTAAEAQLINEFNEIFVDAVTETGGFNTQRVLQLTGSVSDAAKTAEWFVPPANIQQPWALQYHYYSPYDFIFSAWGKTTWGSEDDYTVLTEELSLVRNAFPNTPLILGEYDASLLNTEPAARWKWFDQVARVSTQHGVALVVWDNGLDHLDRNTGIWRDPVALDIVEAVLRGENNSLPDATTDPNDLEQWSSAFVWNRVGETVGDAELPWLFNGNALAGVRTHTGANLVQGVDYTVSSDAVTFTASFLSQFLGPDVAPGSKANLTLTFSSGAPSIVEVIQWDTPEFLAQPAPVLGQDLNIPIEYKGWSMVAAVRAVAEDGTFLFDDWTQWLPPLQQGRITFNGQWFFDGEQVVIRSDSLNAVASLGQPVDFEFEFYPRVPGNSITFTVDPAEF